MLSMYHVSGGPTGGMNGLRRAEVRRLQRRDVLPALDRAETRVEGKTATPTMPLGTYLRKVLASLHKRSPDLCCPWGNIAYDGWLAGLPFHLSSHRLRLSFGRSDQRAGVALVDVRHIFDHASPAIIAYYVGIDSEELGAGLVTFGRALSTKDL